MFSESIRSLGRAGIPVLGYHSPSFVWRTDNHALWTVWGHGYRYFDLEMQKQGVDDMDDFGQRRDVAVSDWNCCGRISSNFAKRVIPVAEEYNVTMALHPDDPPVKASSGIARMFIDPGQL